MDLRDQVVVLAGATGAVGGAFAREVLDRGGKVAATVRRPWQVASLAAALGRERVLVGCVPANDGEAAAGFLKGARDALGPVTAVVCTAGAFQAAAVGKEPAGELQELLEANLLTGATLARAAVGGFRRRRTGVLVFVGSAQVGTGQGPTNYLASKAALHEYVRTLAAELAGSGVRAVALLPGTLDTPASRRAMPDVDPSAWTPPGALVQALCAHAFGPPLPGGPLYPLPIRGYNATS